METASYLSHVQHTGAGQWGLAQTYELPWQVPDDEAIGLRREHPSRISGSVDVVGVKGPYEGPFHKASRWSSV